MDTNGCTGSQAYTLVISKAGATVTLGNLSQPYDGAAENASFTTAPPGLAVNLTYNGSANAPTNVGSYLVVGTINDPNYQGSATNTLVIGKASATVTVQHHPGLRPEQPGVRGNNRRVLERRQHHRDV